MHSAVPPFRPSNNNFPISLILGAVSRCNVIMFTVSLFWHYLQNNIVQIILKMIRFNSNKSNFYLHQQRSVALNMIKMRWRPELCPGPRWGSSRHSPRPLVGWEGGHPLPTSHTLGAFGASMLAPAVFVFQPVPYHFLKRSGAHGEGNVTNMSNRCRGGLRTQFPCSAAEWGSKTRRVHTAKTRCDKWASSGRLQCCTPQIPLTVATYRQFRLKQCFKCTTDP